MTDTPDITEIHNHMTGPEHYALAEQLVAEALELPRVVLSVPQQLSAQAADDLKQTFLRRTGLDALVLTGGVTTNSADLLLAAQVHATLAGVAARVMLPDVMPTPPEHRAWQNAVS